MPRASARKTGRLEEMLAVAWDPSWASSQPAASGKPVLQTWQLRAPKAGVPAPKGEAT